MSDESEGVFAGEDIHAVKAALQDAAGPVPPDATHDRYNYEYHSKGLVVAIARSLLGRAGIAAWPSFPTPPTVETYKVSKDNGDEQLVCHAVIECTLTLVHAESGSDVELTFFGEETGHSQGAVAEAEENALKVAYRAVLQMSRVDPENPPVASGQRRGSCSNSTRGGRPSGGGRSSGGGGGSTQVEMSDKMLTNLVNKDSEVKRWMDALEIDPTDPDQKAQLESVWQDAGQDVGAFKNALRDEAEGGDAS